MLKAGVGYLSAIEKEAGQFRQARQFGHAGVGNPIVAQLQHFKLPTILEIDEAGVANPSFGKVERIKPRATAEAREACVGNVISSQAEILQFAQSSDPNKP